MYLFTTDTLSPPVSSTHKLAEPAGAKLTDVEVVACHIKEG